MSDFRKYPFTKRKYLQIEVEDREEGIQIIIQKNSFVVSYIRGMFIFFELSTWIDLYIFCNYLQEVEHHCSPIFLINMQINYLLLSMLTIHNNTKSKVQAFDQKYDITGGKLAQ